MVSQFETILSRVEKPSRYIGGEVNSIVKTPDESTIRFGFVFPDVYEVGMSHLGMHILYQRLNQMPNVWCERVFAPWKDMENEIRNAGLLWGTQESQTPLNQLDMLGVTLQYELSYSNILNVLNLGGIPVRAEDRTEEHPMIMAGGPCAYNPEPLADFIDLFLLGEGEESLPELVALYQKMDGKRNRRAFLEEAATLEGVYVPSLYTVSYQEDGTIQSITPNHPNAKATVKKRILEDLNTAFYPEKVVVPFSDIVHDRAMIEIFRGCTRGCRFCQAGMLYRPNREKSTECIEDLAQKLLSSTGYEELSLTSLSTCDYSGIHELVKSLIKTQSPKRVSLSLPSLRLDQFPGAIVREIQKVRKTGLTFAPEAGTQRMRDVINKGVTEEDFRKTLSEIFETGWDKVKLYFMIGLPTETEADLDGIAQLGAEAVDLFYQVPKEQRARGSVSVTLSTSSFVPKPFTPFQWAPQDTLEQLEQKQQHLRQKITNRKIKFNYHNAKISVLEGAFARGDRRLGKVLETAWKMGCTFDGWDDYFSFDTWMKAFEACGVDPGFYAHRQRSYDEVLPWDHIEPGVSKDYLKLEMERALSQETTQDCRLGCTGCGITAAFGGGICRV